MRGAPRVFPLIFALFSVYFPVISCLFPFFLYLFCSSGWECAAHYAFSRLFSAFFPLSSRLFPSYFPFLFVTFLLTRQRVRGVARVSPLIFGLFPVYFQVISRLFPLLFCNFYKTHQAVIARRAARFPTYFRLNFSLLSGYFLLIYPSCL